jgi:hypothetical protein
MPVRSQRLDQILYPTRIGLLKPIQNRDRSDLRGIADSDTAIGYLISQRQIAGEHFQEHGDWGGPGLSCF